MRLVIVDDDERVRGVIGELVDGKGHEVVGTAAAGMQGSDLVRALGPDAVIVDLSLEYGSGHDVIAAAHEVGARVIVFSAFSESVESLVERGALIVPKPDFLGLENALDVAAVGRGPAANEPRAERRRRPGRASSSPAGRAVVGAADDFYRALAEASAGDSIMTIDVADESAAHSMAPVVRAVLREGDHLAIRDSQLMMVLVGEGPAPQAVLDRIRSALPIAHEWWHRAVVVEPAELPIDALNRLRELTATA